MAQNTTFANKQEDSALKPIVDEMVKNATTLLQEGQSKTPPAAK